MAVVGGGEPPQGGRERIGGWSWGGFLLNWIWGVGNNTYIALLTFVPFVGPLVMPFVLGAKGNAWAWRNGRWDSVEHFRRVQRRWAMWGFAIVTAIVCLFGAGVGALFYATTNSEAYKMGVARLQGNRAAVVVLGAPISAGYPTGSISLAGAAGRAALEFSATGSKASGRVALQARKEDGAWSLTSLTLLVDGGERSIDLLRENSALLERGGAAVEPNR